jgi:Nif-specific regulatory protein
MSTESFAPRDVARRSEGRKLSSSSSDDPRAVLAVVEGDFAAASTFADGFRRAMRHVGATRCALFAADARQRTMTVEAIYGVSPDEFRPRFGQGVAGRVAESGRPIVVRIVRQEPMALSELSDPAAWHRDQLSLISLPITIGRQSAGALSVYLPLESSDGLGRLRMLQAVASAIARRYESVHQPVAEETAGEASERGGFEYSNMIGTSAGMRQVYEEIGQVARTTATALILGESGTGKELVAHAIHANSERARQPFIKINGAAFPETLFESELFGHERGAFTGAVSRKKGRLDLAQGGTLFLDEVGELPLSTQVKLLRVLQSREFERVGGTETLKANVRLIAATNKNMTVAVANGSFREDLYYRLNVFTITLPPLRDRRADVPALAEYFVEKHASEHRRETRRIASGALDVLCEYSWPGNVRELENAIERAVVVCEGQVVEERHLPEPIRSARRGREARPLSLAGAVEQLERRMIEEALRASQGNLARASRALGTTERILRYKVDKYMLGALRSG